MASGAFESLYVESTLRESHDLIQPPIGSRTGINYVQTIIISFATILSPPLDG